MVSEGIGSGGGDAKAEEASGYGTSGGWLPAIRRAAEAPPGVREEQAMNQENRVPRSEEFIKVAADYVALLRAGLALEAERLTALAITNRQVQCRAEELLLRLRTLSIASSQPAEMDKDYRAFHECFDELWKTVSKVFQELEARCRDLAATRTQYDPSPN
jgi:hypothetical protein